MTKCSCPDCKCNNDYNDVPLEFYGAALDIAKNKPYGELRLKMCNDCLNERHGISTTSALEILKRRFANGDIDENEYIRKRKLLFDSR